MDVNATLFGQMITFVIFVVFTMKFVWPPLQRAMEDRRNKIADGLAAAEQGKKDLERARIKVKEELAEAKAQASHIVEQARQRAAHIIEEAKAQARVEGDRLVNLAKTEIDQEYSAARTQLIQQVSSIAVAGAERILQREIDKHGNEHLFDELVDGI